MADGAFTFTKLIVGDLERSAAFYRDVCGLTEVNRISATGDDGRALTEIILGSKPSGPATLVLITYHGEPVSPRGDSVLGFYTSDIDAFLERVVAAGGRVTGAVKSLPDAGIKYAMTVDNEGHIVEAQVPFPRKRNADLGLCSDARCSRKPVPTFRKVL